MELKDLANSPKGNRRSLKLENSASKELPQEIARIYSEPLIADGQYSSTMGRPRGGTVVYNPDVPLTFDQKLSSGEGKQGKEDKRTERLEALRRMSISSPVSPRTLSNSGGSTLSRKSTSFIIANNF